MFFLLLIQGTTFCSELKVKKERKTLVLNLSACCVPCVHMPVDYSDA